MNKDELKKKICEIIAPHVPAWGEDERIADALIAAGIGDVTEWKEKAKKHRVQVLPDGTIKQLYSDEEVEDIARQRDEYKHRAEVAERELERYTVLIKPLEAENARLNHLAARAERALYNCCFNSLFAPFGIQRPTVDELYDAHLKTAEKELAEEGKE